MREKAVKRIKQRQRKPLEHSDVFSAVHNIGDSIDPIVVDESKCDLVNLSGTTTTANSRHPLLYSLALVIEHRK